MAEVAAHRRGAPRPLIFYLQAALAARSHAVAAAGRSAEPAMWTSGLRPMARELAPAANPLEVAALSLADLREILAGIEAWQRHPWRRQPVPREAIWSEGSARLTDWGGTGRPVLVVPSLVNRAYVLDLMPGNSFLDRMEAKGMRPMLLDWAGPGESEAGLDLGGYLVSRLRPALDAAAARAGGPVDVLGYCMGGTLSVALAAMEGAPLRRLGLIGAPWDFGVMRGIAGLARGAGTARSLAALDAAAMAFGLIPSEFFQQLFAALAPMQAARKFRAFAGCDPRSREAERFVAIEDWLNDPVHVAPGVAREVFTAWYRDNDTERRRWQPAGIRVDPAEIAAKTLIIAGQGDHIAPAAASRALAERMPNAELVEFAMGHVGMVVGSRAHAEVADRLCAHFSK